ncbi:MAG: hypothetical protein Kow0069_12910 [Promethearchaeota archaeon]
MSKKKDEGAEPKATVTGAALVLGGGIAGMSAAKTLSEAGYRVYLVEKALTIGGHMAQLDKTYPTNDCSLCILAPKMVEVARDPNIRLFTNAELVGLDGTPGRYRATVVQRPRYVNASRCTACGQCAAKCPKRRVPDEFNYGLGERRAIFIPFPSAVPATYAIDAEACLHLTRGICGKCSEVCQASAIDYDQQPQEFALEVGAVVVATGFDEIKPESMAYYKRFREASPNVLVGMEFERLMCASGPTGGHVVRRTDGEPAERIAFVQCVGSRNIHDPAAVPYCSRICCMYATKEAVITKEHDPHVECYVFNPECRAYEKNFQDYVNRARDEYGVRFVSGRVGDVAASKDGKTVVVTYELGETGEVRAQEFDLVVMECAVVPSESVARLADVLGAKLDQHRWYTPESLEEMAARNIFVCGCAWTPMNIQESVASGWAAAGEVMQRLHPARGTLVAEVEYPPEIPLDPSADPRIGVLVCRCGTNIGGYVDVPAVVDYVSKLPNVVVATENMYSCSSDSQETIKEMIREYGLNKFIVASCTPRTHEALFRETLREAGVNPYLFELVNIRDQDSWVHMSEPEKATRKACDLIRMHVAKVSELRPQYRQKIEVVTKAMVIGGGVAGLQASLSIARQGIPVVLVERLESLGGAWKEIAGTADGSFTRANVDSLVAEVSGHQQVTVLTGTTLKKVTGFVGNYKVTLDRGGETIEEDVGAIVVATGVIQSPVAEELAQLKPGRVMNQHEFELLLQGTLDLPKNVRVVFQQCHGQRGDPTRPESFSGCGNICCELTLKHVKTLLEKLPEAKVHVLHRGMQLAWKPSEDLARSLRSKAMFHRFDPDAGVSYEVGDAGGEGVVHVSYDDVEVGERVGFDADLVVLATPFGPPEGTRALGPALKVPLTSDGFFLEAHVKLRPLDFATDGIFLAGSAQYPKSVTFARLTGVGAAGRAVKLLSKGYVETEGITAEVDESRCIGCLSCVKVCPFGAIQVVERTVNLGSKRFPRLKVVKKAYVVPASCKGCGTCVATCPKGAISQKHFTDKQITKMIEVFNQP